MGKDGGVTVILGAARHCRPRRRRLLLARAAPLRRRQGRGSLASRGHRRRISFALFDDGGVAHGVGPQAAIAETGASTRRKAKRRWDFPT